MQAAQRSIHLKSFPLGFNFSFTFSPPVAHSSRDRVWCSCLQLCQQRDSTYSILAYTFFSHAK